MVSKKIQIALFSALILGGCKKKAEETPAKTDTTAQPATEPAKEPVPPPAPAPLTGEALGKAFVDGWATWSAGDKAKFQAMYAPDAVSHRPDQTPSEVKGAEAIAADAFSFRDGFPDAKGAPQLVLVNDRTVAAAVLTTGTNTATMKTPMGDMPPTGKKLGMQVFHAVKFNEANLITEEWWVMDGATMAHQMGMDQIPGRPVVETGAAAPTIVVSTGSEIEKANLAATAKGEQDFNKHDVAAMVAGWADDVVESDQSAPADVTGKAEIEKGLKTFLGAFSDGKCAAQMTFAAGDYVVQAMNFTGTHDGDMGPLKKTGKPVSLHVVEIVKYDAGKMKQVWRFMDGSAFMRQLGLMPDPAAAAPAPTGGVAKPVDPAAK